MNEKICCPGSLSPFCLRMTDYNCCSEEIDMNSSKEMDMNFHYDLVCTCMGVTFELLLFFVNCKLFVGFQFAVVVSFK